MAEVGVCWPNHPRKLVTATPTPNAVHSSAAICAPSSWGSKNEDTRIAVTTIRQRTPTRRRWCIPRRARRQQPKTIRQYQPSHSAIHKDIPITPKRAKHVVVRVVRAPQWVGPVGHLGIVHEIGKVNAEPVPVDELVVELLLMEDQ